MFTKYLYIELGRRGSHPKMNAKSLNSYENYVSIRASDIINSKITDDLTGQELNY